MSAIPALACPLCIPFPQTTRADRLIAADVVILAREDDERPFSYAAEQVLQGDVPGGPIDLFVNSSIRRRLAADPAARAVLARDPVDGRWRLIAIADPASLSVYRDLIEQGLRWRGVEDPARIEFFVGLLDSEREPLFRLAFTEVARAPYRVIRAIDTTAIRDRLRATATGAQWIEWRALALLLLGVTDDPEDGELIDQRLEVAARYGLHRDLAALLTASIERRGTVTLSFVRAEYIEKSRSYDELAAVMLALSVHGREGRVELRNLIVEHYRDLVRLSPSLAIPAARDLAEWSHWDLTRELTAALDQLEQGDKPEIETRPIVHYLRVAYRRLEIDRGGKRDDRPTTTRED